jgi:hypothetical protein
VLRGTFSRPVTGPKTLEIARWRHNSGFKYLDTLGLNFAVIAEQRNKIQVI